MTENRRYASLPLDALLLFANSIAEVLATLDHDSQFHSRIGVERTAAQRVWQDLSDELERRARQDPDAYFGRSASNGDG